MNLIESINKLLSYITKEKLDLQLKSEKTNKMKTSLNGFELIKNFEGLRLKAYKADPSEKYYTIGYGHYSSKLSPTEVISRETAEQLLLKDVIPCEENLNKLGLNLNQNQFDALVDFLFNLGVASFNASTLLKKIKSKAPKVEIEAEFLRWNKCNKKILVGLTKRRLEEAKLFFK